MKKMIDRKDILITSYTEGTREMMTYIGLTHLPTGITVENNETKSKFLNREKAFKELEEKLKNLLK